MSDTQVIENKEIVVTEAMIEAGVSEFKGILQDCEIQGFGYLQMMSPIFVKQIVSASLEAS